jgi:hypothetical protein
MLVFGCSSNDGTNVDNDAGHDAGEEVINGRDGGDDNEEIQTEENIEEPNQGTDDGGMEEESSDLESSDEDPFTPEYDLSGCLIPPMGIPDIPLGCAVGEPPAFSGGVLEDGEYMATQIDMFCDGVFTAIVIEYNFSSNGDTHGSLAIYDDDWSLDGNVDLFAMFNVFGNMQEESFVIPFSLSGFSISGTHLIGDYNTCEPVWMPGQTPANELEFDVTGNTVRIKVVLTKEDFISLFPEEYQNLAGLAVAGDMTCMVTLEKM